MFPVSPRKSAIRMISIPWLVLAPVIIVFGLLVTFGVWQFQQAQLLQSKTNLLQQLQDSNIEEAGIIRMQQLVAQEEQQQLEQALIEATSSSTLKQQQTINDIYALYAEIKTKLERNTQANLDVVSIQSKITEWGSQLLKQEYEALSSSLTAAKSTLDDQWSSYQAELVAQTAKQAIPTSKESSSPNPAGYSNSTVQTSRGGFSTKLIKLPLSSVKVKTVSASSSNCSHNCPTKTLAQYVQDQGGFAGINGTYFCPADYSGCSGKVSSYDWAFYNTATGNWINQNALGWTSLGLATFSGSSAKFYKSANQFSGGSVTAAISNLPTLLVYQGSVTISDSDLDTAQKNKGVRGALGIGGGNIFLAIISGASVLDAAHVMKALGATDALNLDGGGSAALYIEGNYKAGPGRLLPNAVVLTH